MKITLRELRRIVREVCSCSKRVDEVPAEYSDGEVIEDSDGATAEKSSERRGARKRGMQRA